MSVGKIFEKISWQMILLIFLLIFFVRNLLTPVIADDYSYAFIWDGAHWGNLIDGMNPDNLQRVENFSDIFISQWQHYFTWGGRTIAHIFVQFFVWSGKILFDFANVFVMAALIFLLFKVGTGLKLREMNKIYLLWIVAGLYFCAPSFFITTIWLTGACNYLWMSCFEILFLLPFALKFWNKNFWSQEKTWQIVLMACLGLIAGWSIEPGGALTVFVTFLCVIYFWREKNLPSWMKVGFIFLCVGFAILILAPGNFYRMELTNTLEPDDIVTPEQQFTADMFLINFVVGFLPDFLREVILFAPIVFYFAKCKTSEKISKFILAFSTASILCLLMMMCSPEFPERAGFPSTIFLLIASTAALKEILPQLQKFYQRRTKILNFAAVIFCGIFLLSMLGCVAVENDIKNQLEARDKIILQHKSDDLIIVPPLEVPSWSEIVLGTRTWDNLTMWWGGDLESDVKGNRGILFAKYHGLKKIITTEREE